MDRVEAVNAVQRMQDFMETHLHEPMTLNDLARAAGYSQWHASRMFRELTGKSPFEYLRALRLSKAALMLRDDAPRVIDVAFDFVFDSHEGFTRAFTRQFGVAPGRYSRKPEPIGLFMPYSVRSTYLTFNKEETDMSEEKKPARFSYRWWNGLPAKPSSSAALRRIIILNTVKRWAVTFGACSPA